MSTGIVRVKSKDDKYVKNIKKVFTNKNTALLEVLYLDTLYFIIPYHNKGKNTSYIIVYSPSCHNSPSLYIVENKKGYL